MNRLANETSPYLLQHQHNPVDWYAWGAEALGKAKAEDKPILLSVGLFRLPLVPRYGAGEFREPADRGADERVVCEYQGRPGRAPRH